MGARVEDVVSPRICSASNRGARATRLDRPLMVRRTVGRFRASRSRRHHSDVRDGLMMGGLRHRVIAAHGTLSAARVVTATNTFTLASFDIRLPSG